jgi:hypothetical protein
MLFSLGAASLSLVGCVLTLPPTLEPDSVRVASDGMSYDIAGSCVSVHGTRVAFGVRGRDDGGANRGAVYVHALIGGAWTQLQKLTPAGPSDYEEFGTSVSLKGGWLAAGAPLSDRDGVDAGSAWIFQSNGVNFVQVQRLVAPVPQPAARFGCSVALDGAGSMRVAVGARRELVGDVAAGAVHIFRLDGQTWLHEARVVAPGVVTEGDDFGQAICLHGDTLAVGAPNEDIAGVNAGAVHVFRLQGTTWVYEALVLSASPEPLGEFGSAVALHANTLAIGAYREDGGATDSGKAHVLTRGATGWTNVQSLASPSPTVGAEFGTSVSLDGNALVVGAPRETNGATPQAGGAYLYRPASAGWMPVARIGLVDGQSSDFMGASVGVSGLLVVSGSPLRSQGAPFQGAVAVTDLSADCDGDFIPDRVEVASGAPDCNGNEIPDSCDIAAGEPDVDGNGIPDACEVVPCPADLNGNGVVSATDLAILIASWVDGAGATEADIDGNGVINGYDLSILLSSWGPCP